MATVNEYKMVVLTKEVPVVDRETLEAWLNQKINDWYDDNMSNKTLGTRVLDLITEAGFTLQPPSATR